jgi:hypothetical protein
MSEARKIIGYGLSGGLRQSADMLTAAPRTCKKITTVFSSSRFAKFFASRRSCKIFDTEGEPMKLSIQVLVTLVLICSLKATAPAGEISCGVDGKAPCAQQSAIVVEEITEAAGETTGAGGETTWESMLTLLQGIMSVF